MFRPHDMAASRIPMLFGTQIAIRLDDDVAAALALLAERRGRTRAVEVREAIRLHVARALTDERPAEAERAELAHHAGQDGASGFAP